MTAGLEMKSLKTRLKGLVGLALLLVWAVSLSSCILLEYRYPEELIRPTNTIGFHELMRVASPKTRIRINGGWSPFCCQACASEVLGLSRNMRVSS